MWSRDAGRTITPAFLLWLPPSAGPNDARSYDITNRQSFENTMQWIEARLWHLKMLLERGNPGNPQEMAVVLWSRRFLGFNKLKACRLIFKNKTKKHLDLGLRDLRTCEGKDGTARAKYPQSRTFKRMFDVDVPSTCATHKVLEMDDIWSRMWKAFWMNSDMNMGMWKNPSITIITQNHKDMYPSKTMVV